MKHIERLQKGMGIGGWLTNYKRFNVLPKEQRLIITKGDMEHFESYITEEDVRYIASLGLDHIRLGFDQIVLEESPYKYRTETFELLHKFAAWCKKYNMRLVLNMHKAIGNYCDIADETGLMQSEELQDRFKAVWLKIEKEFVEDDDVIFELLNEVANSAPEDWNNLAEKTIDAIRTVNKNRLIIVGGTNWNLPSGLEKLKVFDDENIIYTFHCYAPMEFTHQQGVLQAGPLFYNRKMEYPSDDIERYRDYHRLLGNNNAYSILRKSALKASITMLPYLTQQRNW